MFFSLENLTGGKKWLFKICGVSKEDLDMKTNEGNAERPTDFSFLEEDVKWKR